MLALRIDPRQLMAPLFDVERLWAGHVDILLDEYAFISGYFAAIAGEDCFAPIIEDLINVFEGVNKEANVYFVNTNEKEAGSGAEC